MQAHSNGDRRSPPEFRRRPPLWLRLWEELGLVQPLDASSGPLLCIVLRARNAVSRDFPSEGRSPPTLSLAPIGPARPAPIDRTRRCAHGPPKSGPHRMEIGACLRRSGGSARHRDRRMCLFAAVAGPKAVEKLLWEPRFGPDSTEVGRCGPSFGPWWPDLANRWQSLTKLAETAQVLVDSGYRRSTMGQVRPMLVEVGQNLAQVLQGRRNFGQIGRRIRTESRLPQSIFDNVLGPPQHAITPGCLGSALGGIPFCSGAAVVPRPQRDPPDRAETSNITLAAPKYVAGGPGKAVYGREMQTSVTRKLPKHCFSARLGSTPHPPDARFAAAPKLRKRCSQVRPKAEARHDLEQSWSNLDDARPNMAKAPPIFAEAGQTPTKVDQNSKTDGQCCAHIA